MNSSQITQLAIKRHDLDASHFQDTYANKDKKLGKRASVFLLGRNLVLDELSRILEGIPKGSKILDVGCGTAHLTNWILEQGFEVYGIEPSQEMYNYAKQNFPHIEVKKSISSDIPYPDNSFDLIVAFEVLRYLDKDENKKSFKEFHRVLKPGGQFFLTQVNLFSSDFYFIFHGVKSLIYKMKKKVHHHCNFTTSRLQEKEVAAAGFAEVKTVGRFFGSIRIAYKFGTNIGNLYAKVISKISKDQRFEKPFFKNRAGHLIVIGKK